MGMNDKAIAILQEKLEDLTEQLGWAEYYHDYEKALPLWQERGAIMNEIRRLSEEDENWNR